MDGADAEPPTQEWTGERWMVALVSGSTASARRRAREAERAARLCKVLDRFKGARIVDVRRPEAQSPTDAPLPAAGEVDDEVSYADSGVDPLDDV